MFIVPVARPLHRDARQFSRLVDDTVDRFFTHASTETPARSPALDVAESEQVYTVTLEVPGVAKEDVKVSVEGRHVTVRTGTQPQKAVDATEGRQAEQADAAPAQASDRIIYRERAAVRYARSFTLPAEVEQGEAGAKLENGLLTLTLPKRNARAAAQLTVN